MSFQILLVDDDPDFREEFRESLDEYQIIEAASGRQALNILKRAHMIDLVILDVGLPDLSGTEVLTQIKKDSPALGIIILTGRSTKEIIIDALKGHADDFIEKPFSVEALKESIRTLLALKIPPNHTSFANLPSKMMRVKYMIERNYDRNIQLRDIAQEVCLSPKYLSRLFKEQIGLSFNEFRLNIKIEKAKDQLMLNDCTVSELACQFGYQNVESFIRVFKKITGCAPQEFRRKQTHQAHEKYKKSFSS